MAYFENNKRNYKESIEFGIKAIQYDSTTTETLNLLGFNYSMVNNPKESLKYYKKMVEILQKKEALNINNMHRVGYAYFENGFEKEASFYFNEQIKFSKESIELRRSYSSGFWAHYDLAAVYAFLGEKEKAFENLRIFNQKQNLNIVCFRLIKDDPLLNNLRNEPEFQQIEKDIETKYLADHERIKKWLEEKALL
jgi:tetratricopeptide (TPR) repeat protein